MSLRLRAAFVVAAWAFALAHGCGSFDEGKIDPSDGGSPDGVANDDAGPSIPRDLQVVAEWPEDGALDPMTDTRVAKLRVTVTDAADAARTQKREPDKTDRGPYPFAGFTSSGRVDAIVELIGGDERLLGYGEVRSADVSAAPTITIPIRKRILYALAGDGTDATVSREVLPLDLAPTSAEPSFGVPSAAITALSLASTLVLTPDARLLAVAHLKPASKGGVAVFSTSNHQSLRTADLDFGPDEMLQIGNGHDVLVMPGSLSNTATLARVNLDTGAVKPVPSGFQGGSLVVQSAVGSPDGKKVFIAANHRASSFATSKPYLLEYDVTTDAAAPPVEIAELSTITAVRISSDGSQLFVAGWIGVDENAASTVVMTFDSKRGTPITQDTLPANRALSLFIHPSGQRVFLSNAEVFAGGPVAGGTFIVYDGGWSRVGTHERTTNGPLYQLAAAVRLPYAPFRALAGQTDPGNNTNGSMVELTADGIEPVPVTRATQGSLPSLRSLATPFGRRL